MDSLECGYYSGQWFRGMATLADGEFRGVATVADRELRNVATIVDGQFGVWLL